MGSFLHLSTHTLQAHACGKERAARARSIRLFEGMGKADYISSDAVEPRWVSLALGTKELTFCMESGLHESLPVERRGKGETHGSHCTGKAQAGQWRALTVSRTGAQQAFNIEAWPVSS